jgi:hypothetical protein
MDACALFSLANSGALFLGFVSTVGRLPLPAPNGEGSDNIRSNSRNAASNAISLASGDEIDLEAANGGVHKGRHGLHTLGWCAGGGKALLEEWRPILDETLQKPGYRFRFRIARG